MPNFWEEHADAWLEGFDDVHVGGQAKPVRSDMEAEVDEAAVGNPDAGS